MYGYSRMENSGLAKANRGILYPRRSIFDVVHDRGNLYNSRTNSWRIIRLPFAFRVLLRSSQTSFLPYNSHQYLWLRILTKDSLHPSPQSSSHRIFSHCPSSLEYVEDPSFVKHLISWRILKRRSTTTLSNTVIDRTARFHYPTLTPFPREITIPIRGEGSIFTLIELEANQRSLIFELYSRSNIGCSTVLIVLFHVY